MIKVLYFNISTLRSMRQCTVWLFSAVPWRCALFRYFPNYFEMVPIVPVVSGITFVITFHTRYYFFLFIVAYHTIFHFVYIKADVLTHKISHCRYVCKNWLKILCKIYSHSYDFCIRQSKWQAWMIHYSPSSNQNVKTDSILELRSCFRF